MLGTGNALVTRCYNTCFVIESDRTKLLVDAGGGNGVLAQLARAGLSPGDIHDVFVTHSHTDHILGVIWVIRLFVQRHAAGKFGGVLRVWSHHKVIGLLRSFCEQLLAPKQWKHLQACVEFHVLADREAFSVGDFRLQCFDILSTKELQYGFTLRLPDGLRLACLGDEPYNETCHDLVAGADWLLCEAFCKYADRDIFKPYEKNHSTARDAALLARRLGVSHLVLYHTEDETLATRKEAYTAEARACFDGAVWVPDDLEVIPLG